MTTKSWTIEIDGRKHAIELKHGFWGGKREIRIDGILMEESRKIFDTGSDHTFQIAGHSLSLHIYANNHGFAYDCGVDGLSIVTGLPVDFKDPKVIQNLPNHQAYLLTKWKLAKQLKASISWFYIIAALSVINSLVFIFNGDFSFVVGLGFTQFVDGVALGISEAVDPSMIPTIRTIGLVINLGIAGGFVGLGISGSKGHKWAIITGIVLYSLDVIILIIALDWLSILLHGVALFGMFSGLRTCSQLSKLDSQAIVVPPERIAGIY